MFSKYRSANQPRVCLYTAEYDEKSYGRNRQRQLEFALNVLL